MPKKKGLVEVDPRVRDFIKQAEAGDVKRLQNALKSRKFEVDADDAEGATALMRACGAGQLEAVKLLVDKGAGMWCVGPHKDPKNAFMWAAHEGRLEVIRYFVEEVGIADGINSTAGKSKRKSAMDYALERQEHHDRERSDQKYQVLAYIRQKGGVFGEGVTDPAIVFEAAAQGDAHYVLYCIVSCPAHLTTRYGSHAYSLLHVAANAGHLELAIVLLAYEAAVEASDRAGRTPLMMAAQAGHEPVLRLLMEHDARIDAQDLNGSTALHMAAFSGHLPCVKALLSRAAPDRPSEQARRLLAVGDSTGRTPLILTFSGGVHVPVIRYLLGVLDGSLDPIAIGRPQREYRNSELEAEATQAHQDLLSGKGGSAMPASMSADGGATGAGGGSFRRIVSTPDVVKPRSLAARRLRSGRAASVGDTAAPGAAAPTAAAAAASTNRRGTAGAATPNTSAAATAPAAAEESADGSSSPLDDSRVGKQLERRTTQFRVIPRQASAGTLRVTRFLDGMRGVLWGFDSSLVSVISRADLMQAGGIPAYETARRAGWLVGIDDIPQGAGVLFVSHRHYGPDFPDKGNSTFSQVFKFLQSEVAGGTSDYVWIDFTCLSPLDRADATFPRHIASALPALLRCTHFLAVPMNVELPSTPAPPSNDGANPAADNPGAGGIGGSGRDDGPKLIQRSGHSSTGGGPSEGASGRGLGGDGESKSKASSSRARRRRSSGVGVGVGGDGGLPPRRGSTARLRLSAGDEKEAASNDEESDDEDAAVVTGSVAVNGMHDAMAAGERAPLEAVTGPVQEEAEPTVAAAGVPVYSDLVDFLSRGWVQFEGSLALLLGLEMHLCIRWGFKVSYQPILPEPLHGDNGTVVQAAGFRGAAVAAGAQLIPELNDDPDLWEKAVRVFGGGTYPEDPSIVVKAGIAEMVGRCKEPQDVLTPFVAAALVLHEEKALVEFMGGLLDPVHVIGRLSMGAISEVKACFLMPGELTLPDDRTILVTLYLVAVAYMMGLFAIGRGGGGGAGDCDDDDAGVAAAAAALASAEFMAGKPKAQLQLELAEAWSKIRALEEENRQWASGAAGPVRAPDGARGQAKAPVVGTGGCGCVVS